MTKRVNQYLCVLGNIRVEYEKLVVDSDQLDQSILAKAFRGELVPQGPNNEPAALLLERLRNAKGERIRAEREKVKAKGKRQKSKKRK